jgi:tetratricopeptide (TPR) repeat protein
VLSNRLVMALGLAGLVSPLSTVAWAAPASGEVRAEIAGVESTVDEVATEARTLELEVAPSHARLSPSAALQRYQDAVYLYLIGEHAEAAESFFALVMTDALENSGLETDAEWYLAESLFEMGSAEIAEATYRRMSAVPGHPFREDSVRRLLEIYTRDEDSARFDALYQTEILRGDVQPSDLILYAVGKAFYIKEDWAKAKSYMMEIGLDSAYFGRARYFLGAMFVAQGGDVALRESIPYFQEIVALEASNLVDRQVQDLALLALARVYYEFGEFQQAVESYTDVGSETGFLDEKLHELVWANIKQGEYDRALDAVDIFLLAFPEHHYASDLQLVRGHLLYRDASYEEALAAYRLVVDDYAPVRDRFGRLAEATDDSSAYFDEVRELDRDDLYAPRNDDELPAYAVARMLADGSFRRALSIYDELALQEQALSESETLVEQLQAALGGGDAVVDLVGLRRRVAGARTRGLAARIDLLEAEASWLEAAGDGAGAVAGLRERLQTLSRDNDRAADRFERVALDAEVAWRLVGQAEEGLANVQDDLDALSSRMEDGADELSQAELDAATTEVGRLEQSLTALRLQRDDGRAAMDAADNEVDSLHEISLRAGTLWQYFQAARGPAGIDTSTDPTGARVDALHLTIDQALSRLDRVSGMLGDAKDTERFRIHETVIGEAAAVLAQRADLGQTTDDAARVASVLVRDNFRRLQAQFAESVLGADMGIVNVHWSQWVAADREHKRLASERSAVVAELERRFAFLQQKLSQ